MLDSKTLSLLLFLQDHKNEWTTESDLIRNGFAYDSFWFGYLKEMKYIDCAVHLEEQYRITPIGESATIEHNRTKKSDMKSTIAIIISIVAIIISFVSLCVDASKAQEPTESSQSQTISAQYH